MHKNHLKQNIRRCNSRQESSVKLPPVSKKDQIVHNELLNLPNYQDYGLISLLHEYFLKNNLVDTLDTFQRECMKGFKQSSNPINQMKEKLLNHFDNGNRQGFFQVFNQYVPLSMREKNTQSLELQFYMQVYFFIYPTHPHMGKKRIIDATSKQFFKNYLKGKGQILAQSNKFLNFYALVTIQKPQQNQKFKKLYTKQWIVDIRKQLKLFLDGLYPSNKVPQLVIMFDNYIEKYHRTNAQQEYEIQQQIQEQEEKKIKSDINQNELRKRIQQLQEYNISLLNIIENDKKKFHNLQNIYQQFSQSAHTELMSSQQKWFKIIQQFYNIATKLLQSCRKLQNKEQLDDPKSIQKINHTLCKYQSFISMNFQDLFKDNTEFSLFDKPDSSFDCVINQLVPLKWDKVKQALLLDTSNQPEKQRQKCLLVQALKWRVTRTKTIQAKRQVVISLTKYDIFNMEQGGNIFLKLLSQGNDVIMSTVQFICALSRDFYGREYLNNELIYNNLINLLLSPQTDSKISNKIIIFLQLLSTRKLAQITMINNNIIKLIITKLDKQRDTISQYNMEYTAALLLNIVLPKEGMKKAQQIKQYVLTTLINLMQCQITTVRSFILGTLFPLLSNKVFRNKAKQYGMEHNISYLLKSNPPSELERQLLYLEEKLKMDEDELDEDEEENQEDIDIDDIADEQIGEDYEVIFSTNNQLMGQDLLAKNFLLAGPQSIKQIKETRMEARRTLSLRIEPQLSQIQTSQNALVPINRIMSNNNSEYSNRSSNRALRSQKNTRKKASVLRKRETEKQKQLAESKDYMQQRIKSKQKQEENEFKGGEKNSSYKDSEEYIEYKNAQQFNQYHNNKDRGQVLNDSIANLPAHNDITMNQIFDNEQTFRRKDPNQGIEEGITQRNQKGIIDVNSIQGEIINHANKIALWDDGNNQYKQKPIVIKKPNK